MIKLMRGLPEFSVRVSSLTETFLRQFDQLKPAERPKSFGIFRYGF